MIVPKAMIERVESKFLSLGNRAKTAADLVRQGKVTPPRSGDLLRDFWTVDGRQSYSVSIHYGTCACPDSRAPMSPRDNAPEQKMCKHMIAAMFYASLEREADGLIIALFERVAKADAGIKFDVHFDSFFGGLGTRRFLVYRGYTMGADRDLLEADDGREVNLGRLEFYMKRYGIDMRDQNDHMANGSIRMAYPMVYTGEAPVNLHWLHGLSKYATEKRQVSAGIFNVPAIHEAIRQSEEQLAA